MSTFFNTFLNPVFRMTSGNREVTFTPGATITKEDGQVSQIKTRDGKVITIPRPDRSASDQPARLNDGTREVTYTTPGVTITKEGDQVRRIVTPSGKVIDIPRSSDQPTRSNEGSREVTYTRGATITREGDQVRRIVTPGGKVLNIPPQ